MFTGTNKDRRGVARGECRNCPEDCEEYSQPISRDSCDYCGCPAGNHVRLPDRPELVIKVEPGEEGAHSEDARAPAARSRSRAGPSRRTDLQLGVGAAMAVDKTPRPQTSTAAAAVAQVVSRQKRCRELFKKEGVTFENLKIGDRQKGVFLIRYKDKVVYLGEPKKAFIKAYVKSLFVGSRAKDDIGKFIKRVQASGDKAKYLKVAWLQQMNPDPHCNTCKRGKRELSFRQCISDLQGEKPRSVLLGLMGK